MEPVGLQRVVQRRTPVTGTGGRGQGPAVSGALCGSSVGVLTRGLLRNRSLRGRRTRGAEVVPALRATRLRALELAGDGRVLTARQAVLTGRAVVVALGGGEPVGRGLAVRGRLTAEDVRADEGSAVLLRGGRLGPRELVVLRGVLAEPGPVVLVLAGTGLTVLAGCVLVLPVLVLPVLALLPVLVLVLVPRVVLVLAGLGVLARVLRLVPTGRRGVEVGAGELGRGGGDWGSPNRGTAGISAVEPGP